MGLVLHLVLYIQVLTSFLLFYPVQKLKMEIDNVMAGILSFESGEEKWVSVGENPPTTILVFMKIFLIKTPTKYSHLAFQCLVLMFQFYNVFPTILNHA